MPADDFVIHYRVESLKTEGSYDYYTELLERVLNLTESKYGPYKLVPMYGMNFSRTLTRGEQNNPENFLFVTSYSSGITPELSYIPKPIYFGIMGYRVCFTSKQKLEELGKVETVEQLRRYTIGQGDGWLDVGILKANEFKVVEHASHSTLFPSVARGRFDLFCRGINELLPEWEEHKSIPDFAIEESFALYYPFPRFFWTHSSNKELIARITEGLTLVFDDGSAMELMLKHNKDSILFSRLKERRVFFLKNPLLEGLVSGLEEYSYDLPGLVKVK